MVAKNDVIVDDPSPIAKRRDSTFRKRRHGLVKKAHELATLCDCEVSVLVIPKDGSTNITKFSSGDFDQLWSCFEEFRDRGAAEGGKTSSSPRSHDAHPLTSFRHASDETWMHSLFSEVDAGFRKGSISSGASSSVPSAADAFFINDDHATAVHLDDEFLVN